MQDVRTLSFTNSKGYIFIVRRLGKQSKLILSRLDSISNLKLNLRIHGLCGPDAHAGADLQVFLIFCFKPILLSAHKLILLIYGDNTLSVVEDHLVSREWGGLSLVGFLGQRVVQVLSHPGTVGIAWSLGWSLGDHLRSYPPGSTSLICRATLCLPCVAPTRRIARPVRCALPRPDRGCPVTPAGVMEWGVEATIITAREGTSVDALTCSVAGTARAALSLCQGAL